MTVSLPMLIEAIELVVNSGSAARFQRKMRVGFATAGKLLGRLEDLGVVGPEKAGGRRAREVLVKPDDLPSLLAEVRAPREVAADQPGEAS
ncbi:DNA translocase FtsK [Nonomuraea sp. NPDC048901]|uniref:DNA translocase FtsK n=1 Tax=Nonomuraea sp. NPDC048901 TaxID=3155627 RepID=UPI0033C26438